MNGFEAEYYSLIQKGYRFLEAKNKENASFAFKQAIDLVDECGDAYLGLFLVKNGFHTIKELNKSSEINYLEDDYFRKARAAQNEALKIVLDEIETNIRKNKYVEEYEFLKQVISSPTSDSRLLYESLHHFYNFVLNSPWQNGDPDIKEAEELLKIGTLKFCKRINNEVKESEDIFKLNFALETLTQEGFADTPEAKQLYADIESKKRQLQEDYREWSFSIFKNKLIDVSNMTFADGFQEFRKVSIKLNESDSQLRLIEPKSKELPEFKAKSDKELVSWLLHSGDILLQKCENELDAHYLLNSIKYNSLAFPDLMALEIKAEKKYKSFLKQYQRKRFFISLLVALGIVSTLGLAIALIVIGIKAS